MIHEKKSPALRGGGEDIKMIDPMLVNFLVLEAGIMSLVCSILLIPIVVDMVKDHIRRRKYKRYCQEKEGNEWRS